MDALIYCHSPQCMENRIHRKVQGGKLRCTKCGTEQDEPDACIPANVAVVIPANEAQPVAQRHWG